MNRERCRQLSAFSYLPQYARISQRVLEAEDDSQMILKNGRNASSSNKAGGIDVPSLGGTKYVLILLGDYSRLKVFRKEEGRRICTAKLQC